MWGSRDGATRISTATESPAVRHMPISEYDVQTARAATTTDVLNAVTERRRREILEYLDSGEATVGEIVDRLAIA